MATLRASIELGAALVNTPRLNHPPIGLVVSTLLALCLNLRSRTEILLFLTDDYDLVVILGVASNNHLFGHGLLDPTFSAYIAPLLVVDGAHRAALRAELHFF